ncbi:MAG TPA: hypothetical protein VKD67_04145 [Acidimicrobiales bacterium]|nr:hypothetical protein [Acidimicrobiales bacterium]
MAADWHTQLDGTILIVDVAGDLGLEGAPALDQLPRVDDVQFVVVDTRWLTFLGSTGLGAPVGLHRRLQQRAADLHLVVVPESLLDDCST